MMWCQVSIKSCPSPLKQRTTGYTDNRTQSLNVYIFPSPVGVTKDENEKEKEKLGGEKRSLGCPNKSF